MKKKGLGKGLGALLTDENASIDSDSITEIKLINIEPNPDQPRKAFNDESLEELADSIRQHGVINPILVHESQNGYYMIIAGERRWRASKLAGLKSIPAIIKKNDEDEKTYELSLIENLQRQDLNPIEEALGYKRLMDEYDLTQEQVSEKVSKSRSSVANSLRLLNLPKIILDMIAESKISVGHAKVLMSVSDENKQTELAQAVYDNNYSVRELEDIIKKSEKKPAAKKEIDLNMKLAYKNVEKAISSLFGTKVKIIDKNNKGKIQIEYYSAEDLERILNILKTPEKNDL